jgi:hypothetical protein
MNLLFLFVGYVILCNIEHSMCCKVSDGFANSPAKYYTFRTFYSKEQIKRSHPEKYPKYEYVSDKTGLYCKLHNVTTYIHESGMYFLLEEASSNKITRNALGKEVVLTKSFKSGFWEHGDTQYYMSLSGYWDGVNDELCDSILKKKTNSEEGDNDAYDEADGTERKTKEVEPNTNNDNGNSAIMDQDVSGSKGKEDILPLYVGGGISLFILFTGCIICYIIVKYPYGKFSNWITNIAAQQS